MLEADEEVPGLKLLGPSIEDGGRGLEGVGLERCVGKEGVDSGALIEGVCQEDAVAGICSRRRSLGDGKREEEGREEKIEGQQTERHGFFGI